MTTCKYLHRKGERFHFRRRIPKVFSPCAIISLPLGTTDQNLAHNWVGHLTKEFDQMFDSFVFMAPPLPEALVARYFRHCLEDSLFSLRRQVRMARMSGRFGADDETRLSLMPMILQSLLEDGIRDSLPQQRVDPEWSPETLDIAMHLYSVEARRILSPEETSRIQQTFPDIKPPDLTSAEHTGQLREAYIAARLEALRDGTAPVNFASMRVEPRHYDLVSTGQNSAIDNPKGADPSLPDQAAEPEAARELLVSQLESQSVAPLTTKLVRQPAPDIARPAPKSICKTMASLADHFAACQDEALAADSDTWSTDIAHVFWRTARAENMTQEVAQQRRSDVRRFMLILGITSVTQITQAKLSHWRDILQQFPKKFLRSDKDSHLELEAILLSAKHLDAAARGLASSTLSRHVKSIELLIKRAVAEGVTDLKDLDLGHVKPKKTSGRNRHKKRASFSPAETNRLLSHSLWTGASSKARRHNPGSVVTRDGAWWIPLILMYTGARRAEIAGMLSSDIQDVDGIPAFIIQSNKYRGIKGEPKDAGPDEKLTRIVPIHSQLLDLGLLDYAEHIRAKGHSLMFPDVVPTPRKGSVRAKAKDPALLVEKFGEKFDDAWNKSMKLALEGNPRKLCIHSLRHFVNNTLIHDTEVHEVTRFDLIGHVEGSEGQNTNTSTYRDETPMAIKREAIEKLPRLKANLSAWEAAER
jgi:integrase